MGTRRFCDHCGNTCRNPKVYSFGPSANHTMQTTVAMQNAYLATNASNISFSGVTGMPYTVGAGQATAGYGGSGGSGTYCPPSVPAYGHTDVDLCNTCAPIWLERVRKLTTASDPDAQSS